MKKIIVIITVLAIHITLLSQSAIDALRYSRSLYTGTARSVSMGGAVGALGGDLTAICTNPAGIAVYRSSEVTLTPGFATSKTESKYNQNRETDISNNFNFNNIGVVSGINNDTEWSRVSFGVAYNKTNNFDRNILIKGVNNSNSRLDYIVDLANQNQMDDFYFQPAWDSYLIDYNEDTEKYWSDFTNSTYGQTQRKSIEAEGSSGEYTFAVGANYSHFLYVGASIGIATIYYQEKSLFSETDLDNRIANLYEYKLNEEFTSRGAGFNMKVGAIVRPINFIRLGVALHTPTYYEIEEDYETKIESFFDNPIFENSTLTGFMGFSPKGEFDYELTTPMKAIGSVAFVLGKFGLISADYEFVDYSTIRMRAGSDSFDDVNETISDTYTATSNIRAGGELLLGMVSLRAGVGLYGSPYKSLEGIEDALYTTYSGGMGFSQDDFFVDFAYIHTQAAESYFLYDVYPNQLKTESKTDFSSNRFMLTVGYKF